MKRNKWLIALAASGIHVSIGSVYSWSVLTLPIIALTGWSLTSVTFIFSISILFLGLSAGFLGKFVEKLGPMKTGLISTACFITGLIGSALAISVQNLWLLYLFYGVIGGCGLGIGYICPVSTLVKYFPRSKGFATGLAIMSFGFASVISAPLMQYLVTTYGLVSNFLILGFGYAFIMILSSLYLAPPEDYVEDHHVIDVSPNKVYKSWQFKALWFIFFINISCGIALLSVNSMLLQDVIGVTAEQAAGIIGIVGLVNGGGRILWSSFSDIIGRSYAYIIFFVLEVVLFFLLTATTNQFIFVLAILLIISCYGGGFSCMPAYLSDIFGNKYLSTIHGRILTAWSAAGICGPLLISFGKEVLGDYTMTLYGFSFLFMINLIIAVWLHRNKEMIC